MDNLESGFLKLRDFLAPYTSIITSEPLEDYPNHLAPYPLEWIEDLKKLSKTDLYLFSARRDISNISNPSFLFFLNQCKELSRLRHYKQVEPIFYKDSSLSKITGKKLHELSAVNEFAREKKLSRIIDFAGGKGHLSYILSKEQGLQCTSIDSNLELQESGKKRNAKYKNNSIRYINHFFSSQDSFGLAQYGDYCLGLHTCGGLSKILFDESIKSDLEGLLNFGCCYFKMNKSDYHLSKLSQERPLALNPYSLSLAARSHGSLSKNKYDLQISVKFYRYMFKFFLEEFYNISHSVVLKTSRKSIYRGSFSSYAKEQLNRLNLTSHISDSEIEKFSHNLYYQNIIWDMLYAHAIRSYLGKPLEVYLILDRALYLFEKNYKVEVLEFFNEDISPRSIGIFAKKKALERAL